MSNIDVKFAGPFTFTDGAHSVFRSRFADSPGIYLWTVRQRSENTHLIHYVGEMVSLAKRHREHLIRILGMNYGIFDAEEAQEGVCQLVW